MNQYRCGMHNQHNCSICMTRRPNECDFGTCWRKATVKITTPQGEVRPICGKHAKYIPGVQEAFK